MGRSPLFLALVCLLVAPAASLISGKEGVAAMCENLGMQRVAQPSQSRMLLSQKKAKSHLAPQSAAPQHIPDEVKATDHSLGAFKAGSFDHVIAHMQKGAKEEPTVAVARKIEEALDAAAEPMSPEAAKHLADHKAQILKALTSAQQTDAVLKVGISHYPPYAFYKNEGADVSVSVSDETQGDAFLEQQTVPQWDGFSVQVWEEMAKKNNWKFEYVNGTFSENLLRLKNGELDTLATGMFLTDHQRKAHPAWTWSMGFWMSGMGIMVKTGEPPSTLGLLFLGDLWTNLGYLMLGLIGVGHVYWLLEYDPNINGKTMYDSDGNPKANVIPGSWPEGPILGTWWASATATTVGYGDYYPKTWPGRFFATSVMIASLFVVGLWTGEITAALTTSQLGGVSGDITSLASLETRRVAVVEGTFPAHFMETYAKCDLVKVHSMEGAVQLLMNHQVEAVVSISDLIQFSGTMGTGMGQTAMVGFPFHQHQLAFPLPPNGPGGASLSADAITKTLLELQDSDTMDAIVHDFFWK